MILLLVDAVAWQHLLLCILQLIATQRTALGMADNEIWWHQGKGLLSTLQVILQGGQPR